MRSTDNARLAAIITSDVGTLGARVVRSQGVAAVTNPGVGRFCIQPTAASGIVVSSVVPTLSVDYSASTASDRSRMVVQFRSSGGGCPGGTLSVYTLSTGGGAKNGLAFTIVVP